MQTPQFQKNAAYRRAGLVWRLCKPFRLCLVLLLAAPVHAATDIQIWHTLNAHNQGVFERLIAQFNQSQKEIRITSNRYERAQALEAALDQTRQPPHLVQLEEPHEPGGMPKRSDIQPLYRLLDRYPVQDQDWFVSRQYSYARDTQGRLLAFPFMMEIPVMLYNLDAFAKAGLVPLPDRAWDQVGDAGE